MTVIPPSLWRSPFRPFFLLGALYGPLLILSWIPLYTGLQSATGMSVNDLPALHHQHEIVFGFSTAIIFGFILTALPSWAGTKEIRGRSLVLLVLSWVLGRLSVALSAQLPLPLVIILDLSFPLMFAAMVAVDLFRMRYQISLGVAMITAGFFVGNLCYYLGVLQQDLVLWQQGLRIGFYAIVFHCSITVGALAPIFTENALLEKGQPTAIGYVPILEWLSALSIIILAIVDIAALAPAVIGTVALFSCLLHGVRLCRWHSLSITDIPIVWVLHFGYVWLVVCLLLWTLENYGLAVGTQSWIHAFTVGGFGLMSLGLMTRVSLRHTGHEIRPHVAMVAAYLCMAAAALVRVATSMAGLGSEILLLSALLWVVPYVVYLALYGRLLLTPSMPQ
ncbi:MAG: NnrS family protein [Pseudomonadales bacterium]